MNIESLKIFKDLIDTQSYTKTANLNYISQSAVSQQIKKLEIVFKTKLFIKKDDRLILTDVGKILYDASQKILDIYNGVILEIKNKFDTADSGEISIVSVYSLGIYLVNNYIKEFLNKYPVVKINHVYGDWQSVVEGVINSKADFGFIACKNIKDVNITSIHVCDEELGLVTSPNFNSIKGDKVDYNKLEEFKLVFFDKNLPSRNYIESVLKTKGVRCNITMDLNNIETIKAAVASNTGVSILPYNSVKLDVESGRLKFYRFKKPLYRSVYMIYNKRKKMNHESSKFLNMILHIKKKTKGVLNV